MTDIEAHEWDGSRDERQGSSSDYQRKETMKAGRVPARTVAIGDCIQSYGDIQFTVEWTGFDDDSGTVTLAGTTDAGKPHTSRLAEHAYVTKFAS